MIRDVLLLTLTIAVGSSGAGKRAAGRARRAACQGACAEAADRQQLRNATAGRQRRCTQGLLSVQLVMELMRCMRLASAQCVVTG